MRRNGRRRPADPRRFEPAERPAEMPSERRRCQLDDGASVDVLARRAAQAMPTRCQPTLADVHQVARRSRSCSTCRSAKGGRPRRIVARPHARPIARRPARLAAAPGTGPRNVPTARHRPGDGSRAPGRPGRGHRIRPAVYARLSGDRARLVASAEGWDADRAMPRAERPIRPADQLRARPTRCSSKPCRTSPSRSSTAGSPTAARCG